MTDLSVEGVHSFWRDYDKRVLYRIITSMESIEHWILDGDEGVEEGLNRLGRAIGKLRRFEMGEEENLVTIVANLRSSRALRILQSLDAIQAGSASKLLLFAEDYSKKDEGKEAKLFLARNLVFERLQLLSRVFAPERISLVLKALEGSDE